MKKTNILALSLVTAISLQAAPPNIGDVLKEVKPPKLEQAKKELPKIKSSELIVPKEFEDGKKVKIERFSISGAKHISNDELKAIVEPYENRELSFKEILDVTGLITKAYRQKGYFVARAYVPEQNIMTQDSRLKINVIEGNYGEFTLQNNSLVKDSVIQANLDNIKDENIISVDTLERVMLIINDMSGVVVSKAEVKPGKEVGTSDFVIGLDATKKYSGFILGDNYGSQYTGRHRLMIGADINSPFEIGDKISVMGITSQNAGLLNARVAYDFPLLANGTRANISYSKTTYELGSTYKSLDAVGTSDSVALKVVYPLIKSKLQTLKLYLDTSYNSMSDEVKSTSMEIKKDSLVATVGADFTNDYIVFGRNSESRANFSYTFGNLSFKDKGDRDLDKAGANTDGGFSKINLALGQDFDLDDKIKWENSLQMQYALANKNLDGSQDLSMGGINGVKYYPDGEESAENGYIFNTKLLYTLPEFEGINSKISIFYDTGRAYMSKNIADKKARTLQDVGVGYTCAYKSVYLNSHLAKNISGDVESEKQYSIKFLLQAGWIF